MDAANSLLGKDNLLHQQRFQLVTMHVAIMTTVVGGLVMRTMTMLMFMMGQMFYWRLSATLMAHSIVR